MVRALDDPLLTHTGTEIPRGRMRRPSEKVQAMLEENQQEKQALEQRALAKAKRRDELALKRNQANKAAEQDLTKLPSNKVREDAMGTTGVVRLPVALAPDNGFTSRVVQSTHSNNTRANLGSQLTLAIRKGSVPPVPTKATSMLPPRNLTLTPSQHAKLQQLKRHATPYPSALSETTTVTPSLKRVNRRVTPSTNNDENGGDTEPASDSDAPSQWVPRKRLRRISNAPSDDDEVLKGAVDVKSEDSLNPSVAALSQGTTVSVRGGRPKAADLDAPSRTILQTAIQIFCSILLSEHPFPSAAEEEEWAQFAWQMACVHHKLEIPYTSTTTKLTTVRASHIRGQFKSKACTAVKNQYGFQAGHLDEDGIKKNRALVAELKNSSAFIYLKRGASLEKHTGIYASPAIQEVINEVLFKRNPCDGLRWAKYYSPFPRVGFALTLTAIECAIDEWATGTRQDINFREEDYLDVFTGHVNALDEFHTMTAQYKLLPTILQGIFDSGRANAGVVELVVSKEKQAVPTCAFINALREYEQKNGIEVAASSSKDADRESQNDSDLVFLDVDELEDPSLGVQEQHYDYLDEDAEGSDEVLNEDGDVM